MKRIHIILIAALCLVVSGCKFVRRAPQEAPLYPLVKSMDVEFPRLEDYRETIEIEYDEALRPSFIKKTSFYDGKSNYTSWKYDYHTEELKADVELFSWDSKHTATAFFSGDFSHMTLLDIKAEDTEDPETGICFLGQCWEGSYSDGRIVKAVFTDYTSDGIDVSELTWDMDGLLIGHNGSDPGTVQQYSDIKYSESANPFRVVDPLALLMYITAYYWQGLAGPRPAFLVDSFERLSTDPWEIDSLTEHVSFEYTVSPEGLITRISKNVNGEPENAVNIHY